MFADEIGDQEDEDAYEETDSDKISANFKGKTGILFLFIYMFLYI
jgi:hypothetical protein